MAVNSSKMRDERFWKIWNNAGATSVSMPTPVCTQCFAVYNHKHDMPFLVLNPSALSREAAKPPQYTNEAPELHFCSTTCLAVFVTEPQNQTHIAWFDPTKLPTEPEASATASTDWRARFGDKNFIGVVRTEGKSPELLELVGRLRIHRSWRRARQGQEVCVHCNPQTDHNAGEPQEGRPGPFLYVRGFRFYESFCNGITCLLAWCAENQFDAKGYWQNHGTRCSNCQSVYRTDKPDLNGALVVNARFERDGAGPIPLTGHASEEQTMVFCCPTCVVGYFTQDQEAKAKLLYWVPANQHVVEFDDEQEGGCAQCGTHAPSFVAVDAPYWSKWDSMNVPNYFCSVLCIVEAFRADEKHCQKYGFGKWFAPLKEQRCKKKGKKTKKA